MFLVYKTLGSEALDRFYGAGPQLQATLARGSNLMSGNPTDLSDAANPLEQQGHLPTNSASDLKADWLGGKFAAHPVEQIMRDGYEHAIQLAQKSDMPIETFVVAGGGTEFEVHICEGKYAVTVLIVHPEPRTDGSKRAQSRSWVVRAGAKKEKVSGA